jgi:glycosyltransferase involved in cell wall biosynthesis
MTTPASKIHRKKNGYAIIISDVYGQMGGAYRVSSLLHAKLNEIGFRTKCFITHLENSPDIRANSDLRRPLIRRGHRWDIPNRVLALQILQSITRQTPALIISIGLTSLCGHVLRYASVSKQNFWIWELTNAQPGNKFVNPNAIRQLGKCRGILSPATIIDQCIRSTYQYTGEIRRLPFWIEEGATRYTPPPQIFRSDFLFLSRRENDKGLEDLILAAAILKQQSPNFTLNIGGIGDKSPFEATVKQLDLATQVSFLDLPLRPQAMEALENSKFLVMPSHHEGFPISILESTQRSIPVITTRVGAIPQILGEGKAVLYHEPHNPKNLAETLLTALIENNTEYIKRRSDAFTSYQTQFSPERIRSSISSLTDPLPRTTS